jgi:prepilin-type N-terminal cleavage/methylation domain-containing protein/prepilin-type processing-associated H-X9-DG protein
MRKAFTLIELLVVIGIIAVLVAILLPVLAIARASGMQAVCASNIRQVGVSMTEYANDNDGFYPPAHLDFVTKNLHRWHGTRPDRNSPFDFSTSCLKDYLETGQIKRCPAFLDLTAAPGLAFELGCGGYGYNESMGCNESLYANEVLSPEDYDRQFEDVTAKFTMIRKPAEKILLADAAMAMAGGTLIEYSFVGPPLLQSGADSFPGTPSIHFRHRGHAVICWADGHVTAENFGWTYPTNAYGADNNLAHLGYFGPKDNSYFARD